MRVDEWRIRMSENVQQGLAKLSKGADNAASRFTRTQDRINQSVGRSAASIRNGLTGAWRGASQGVGRYLSGLTSALPLPGAMMGSLTAMAGPLGIAVGLVGALTMGMSKAVAASEQFGVPFRELRNLNIEKTDAEIQSLRNSILDMSSEKGLDAQAITKGYYDIQSATGLYGDEVLQLAGRVGEASRALNMDYAAAVSGTA